MKTMETIAGVMRRYIKENGSFKRFSDDPRFEGKHCYGSTRLDKPIGPNLYANFLPKYIEEFPIYIRNGLAHISGRNGLFIADVNDPANPKILGEYLIGKETHRILLKKSYAYIASSNGLEILDVSDPDKITLTAHIGDSGWLCIQIQWPGMISKSTRAGSVRSAH